MTKMRIVNPRLKWFVKQMRKKLAIPKNQEKGDWRETNIVYLLSLVSYEVAELNQALQSDSFEDAIAECADIANVSFMVADNLNETLKDLKKLKPKENRGR